MAILDTASKITVTHDTDNASTASPWSTLGRIGIGHRLFATAVVTSPLTGTNLGTRVPRIYVELTTDGGVTARRIAVIELGKDASGGVPKQMREAPVGPRDYVPELKAPSNVRWRAVVDTESGIVGGGSFTVDVYLGIQLGARER